MAEETFTRHVRIYLDSGQAQAAYDTLIAQQQRLSEQVRKYEEAGKQVPANVAKQFETVNAAVDRQAKKISGTLSPSLRDLQAAYTQLTRELARMSRQDPGFEEKRKQAQAAKQALDNYKFSLSGVKDGLKDMVNTAKGVAFGVLIGGGVQAAVQTMMGGIRQFFQFRNEFENSVRNLSAITGATGADLDFLKNAAIDLSKTGSRAASEFVEAMKLIGSAKPELLQNKEGLVQVTQAASLLAKASGLELPDAATRLTDAMNQFNLPAEKAGEVVDRLAAAAKWGAAEVPQITQALLEFGSQAKASNVTIGESAALIETLAEKGIKGAEAGTKLRNVLLAMNAANALDAKAQEDLRAAGVNMAVLSNTSLSLEERLTELGKIANNSTALVHVFGKENFNAAQIVLNSIPRYAELNDQIKESGVASSQAATNVGGLSSAWGKLMNNIAALFLQIDTSGLAKRIRDLNTALFGSGQSMVETFRQQATAVKNLQENIEPLLNRHDALKEKTTLSKEEQKELRTIIQRVSTTVPSAISAFDKYGQALGINTEKARAFIKEQQVLMQYQNREAIAEVTNSIKTLQGVYENTYAELTKGARMVYTEQQLSLGLPGTLVKLTNEEVAALQTKVAGLMQRMEDAKLLLKSLRGETIGTTPVSTPPPPGGDDVGNVKDTGKETQKVLEKVQRIIDETLAAEAALAKGMDEVYALQLRITDRYYEERSLQLKEQFAKGEIDEETYRVQQLFLEQQHLQARLQVAKNFAAESKKAEADVVEFSIAARNQQLDTEIKLNEMREALLKEGTEAEISAAQQRLENWQAYSEDYQQVFSDMSNYAMTVFSNIDRIQTNKENARLKRQEKEAEQRKKKLQQDYDNRLISESELAERTKKIDEDLDKKKAEVAMKQFRRQQAMGVAKAIISGALASMKAWEEYGWPWALIPQAMIVAVTAAEIASIESQEPPSYGMGGDIEGPSHSEGGVMINAEGGEYVVNKRSTARYRPLLKMLNETPTGLSTNRASQNMERIASGSSGITRGPASESYGSGAATATDPNNALLLAELREMKHYMKTTSEKDLSIPLADVKRKETTLRKIYSKQT